jgi:pimeloyl-ACP methyl ester carboxylesterase
MVDVGPSLTQAAPLTGTVTVDGVRLGYDVHGSGADTVVLLPALLMSRKMQEPLARRLALRHIRVICLDYLGERVDGSPHESSSFSSELLGLQTVAALEALGVERAVIGGTSIGSNIAIEAALADPSRFTGLLLEGPFVDHAAYATAFAFSAVFIVVTIGRPALRTVALAARALSATPVSRIARRLGISPNMVLDDPARATAFLQGVMFGRIGPPRELRSSLDAPALVIGFPLDPFHPLSDATAVTEDLALARMIRTSSIADLRIRPERLAGEIARFVGDCRRRAEARSRTQAAA